MSSKHVTSVEIQNGGRRTYDKTEQNSKLLKADSDQIDLDALLKAVLEVSEQDNTSRRRPESAFSSGYSSHGGNDGCSPTFALGNNNRSKHNRRSSDYSQATNNHVANGMRRNNLLNRESRQNLSFTNEKVYDIDRENERLLREITKGPKRKKLNATSNKTKPIKVLSSSEINRQKYQQKIERENLALLNRLEKVKPSKGLAKKDLIGSKQQPPIKPKNRIIPQRRPGTSSTLYSSRTTSRVSSISDLRSLESRCASNASTNVDSSRSASGANSKSVRPMRLQQPKYVKPIWEPGW